MVRLSPVFFLISGFREATIITTLFFDQTTLYLKHFSQLFVIHFRFVLYLMLEDIHTCTALQNMPWSLSTLQAQGTRPLYNLLYDSFRPALHLHYIQTIHSKGRKAGCSPQSDLYMDRREHILLISTIGFWMLCCVGRNLVENLTVMISYWPTSKSIKVNWPPWRFCNADVSIVEPIFTHLFCSFFELSYL